MYHIIIYYNLTSPTLSLNVLFPAVVAIQIYEVICIHSAESAWFYYGALLIITVFTVAPLSLTVRELMLPDSALSTYTLFPPTAP